MMVQLITGTGLGGAIIVKGDLLVGPLAGHRAGAYPDRLILRCGPLRLRFHRLRRNEKLAHGPAKPGAAAPGSRRRARRAAGRSHGGRQNPPEAGPAGHSRSGGHRDLEDLLHQPGKPGPHRWPMPPDAISSSSPAARRNGKTASPTRHSSATWTTPSSGFRENLEAGFPHLKQVKVEWAIDEIPDSAAYGTAQYAAAHLE
jgi:hypothetical protein